MVIVYLRQRKDRGKTMITNVILNTVFCLETTHKDQTGDRAGMEATEVSITADLFLLIFNKIFLVKNRQWRRKLHYN